MPARALDGPGLLAALAAARPPFLLDIRDPRAFETGHLPGSVHIEVYDLGRRRRELPGTRVEQIVVVGEPGRRTEAGVRFLELMGFADLAVLTGGVDAYPGDLETGPPPPPQAKGPVLRTLD